MNKNQFGFGISVRKLSNSYSGEIPFFLLLASSIFLIASVIPASLHGVQPEARAAKNEGDRLAAEGDVEGALWAYRRAIEIEPDYALARNELGTVLFRLGRIPEAITEFQEAVSLDDDYATAWFNLAFASRRAEEWDQAVEAYRKHIELRPDEPDAWYGLGESLFASGDKLEAADAFEAYASKENRPARRSRAVSAMERAERLRRQEAERKAEASSTTLMEEEEKAPISPDEETDPVEDRASDEGPDEEEMRREYLRRYPVPEVAAVQRQPEESPVKAKLTDEQAAQVKAFIREGDAWIQAGDFRWAAESFQRAVNIDPENIEALYKLGTAYALNNDYTNAIDSWTRVLMLEPGNQGARRNIELARERMPSEKKDPVEENDNDSNGYAPSDNMSSHMKDEDSHDSRRPGNIRTEPDLTRDQLEAREAYHMGARLMGENNFEEALMAFSTAMDFDPSLIHARIARGSALMGLKRYQEAMREYQSVLRIRPDLAAPLFGLGEINRVLGDLTQARNYYRRYIESSSPDVDPALLEQARRWLERL